MSVPVRRVVAAALVLAGLAGASGCAVDGSPSVAGGEASVPSSLPPAQEEREEVPLRVLEGQPIGISAGTIYSGDCTGEGGRSSKTMVYFDTEAGVERTVDPRDTGGSAASQRQICAVVRGPEGLRVMLVTEDGVNGSYRMQLFAPGDQPGPALAERTIEVPDVNSRWWVGSVVASGDTVGVSIEGAPQSTAVTVFDVEGFDTLWTAPAILEAANDDVYVIRERGRTAEIRENRVGRVAPDFTPLLSPTIYQAGGVEPHALIRTSPPEVLRTTDMEVFRIPQSGGGSIGYSNDRVSYTENYTVWVYDFASGQKLVERTWPQGSVMSTSLFRGETLYLRWGGISDPEKLVIDVNTDEVLAAEWTRIPLWTIAGWSVVADDFCLPHCSGLTAVPDVDGRFPEPR